MRRDGVSRTTSREVRARAKQLRKEQTPAEERLWRVLRQKAVNGLKFRRQHPMEGLILDFYCSEASLCVELDGGIHDTPDQQERDAARTAHLEARGIRVIRFRNEEVLTDINSVLTRIAQTAAQPVANPKFTPPPAQFAGGGGRA